MKKLFFFFWLLFGCSGFSQFTVGIKIGGLAFHQQKASPNYYKWSIDKNGRWVGYMGISFVAGYQFNSYLGVKIIQTILPYDCGGKISGITDFGIDFHDRLLGINSDKHRFSASFGPLFYYRKNWHEIPDYYEDEGFLKNGKNNIWERRWVWYGGQIQYDYYYNPRESISTNFLPGYPYLYTFMTGIQTTL